MKVRKDFVYLFLFTLVASYIAVSLDDRIDRFQSEVSQYHQTVNSSLVTG